MAALRRGEKLPPPLPDLDPGPEPQEPRLRQADTTVEKMAELLAGAAPKGLLIVRNELAGFLLGMTAYRASGRQFWLESYDGASHRVERVKFSKALLVPHLTVAVHGGIQPDRLAELMRMPDDGMLARQMMFWPDPIRFRLGQEVPDITFAVEALDKLRVLEMLPVHGRLEPIRVPLTADAEPILEDFARQMERRQAATIGLYGSALGKARGLALRLSLVLELLRWAAADADPFHPGPPERISAAAVAGACQLVGDYAMPMALRVYGDARANAREQDITLLARWISTTEPRPAEIHVRHMQKKVRLPGLKDAAAIHAACAGLVDAGWLLPGNRPNGAARARASYPVNPRLWPVLDRRDTGDTGPSVPCVSDF
jgi:hypothetical protein